MTAAAWLGRAGCAALVALGALTAPAALAQQAPVVVELFTSQGCIACPPADAFFAELADQPGVIALALHVDYWDYLGWEDSFAAPAFTQRQKRYARAASARMIYTPQVIVNGQDRVEGTRPQAIIDSITARAATPPRVTLSVTSGAGGLVIDVDADPPLDKAAVIQLVRYHPEETVEIERGENAGQTITYRNIVTDWRPIADWPGQAPLRIETPDPGADPLVVIVQQAGPGPILAAARLDD
ncbi:DUF1223 domain-containing protein [Gemmobacter nectariphilus]|uniref:DUF1223 domain-containing protein n=1 Tax=Gemmobacter nectariphilus TaxID=220343 RepID=UPI00040AF4F6|nr:DUF1223 domain-containing protein [Gemmobacter nectariphilus]